MRDGEPAAMRGAGEADALADSRGQRRRIVVGDELRGVAAALTHVDLTWLEKRFEH